MIIDVIAGIVLLISIIISILRGFVREVLTILGILGGTIAAYIGGPLLSPSVKNWMGVVEDPENAERFLGLVSYAMLADGVAYIAVFIIFVIVLSVISHFLAESVRNVGLGAIDRTLGMVFGLVRGVLFLGLLYMPVHFLVEDGQVDDWPWLKTSKSRVYLEATSGWIAGFIPSERMEKLEEATKNIEGLNETRKMLQEMDVLPVIKSSDEFLENTSEDVPAEGAFSDTVAPSVEGYTNDSRSEMDALIENALEE